MTYSEWIAAYVARKEGKLLGQCATAVREMKLGIFNDLADVFERAGTK